ncbi:MAG: helix-turn-helix transcriptional regulator [Aeriscardovia sp.]|nr:helix-turn-helix transcriptional regulator [Clostridia bacterium]MBO5627899.1 helix-turn-helix transcriptional regulator [Aeriscardovia sp.]
MGTKENEFTEKLRMLMDERDMKQKDVAAALHIPVSTLGGYVQGKSQPDFAMLKLLSNYFNVSIDYLLDNTIGSIQTEKESELLRIFRSLTSEQQELYIEQGRAFIKVNARSNAKSSKSAIVSNRTF